MSCLVSKIADQFGAIWHLLLCGELHKGFVAPEGVDRGKKCQTVLFRLHFARNESLDFVSSLMSFLSIETVKLAGLFCPSPLACEARCNLVPMMSRAWAKFSQLTIRWSKASIRNIWMFALSVCATRMANENRKHLLLHPLNQTFLPFLDQGNVLSLVSACRERKHQLIRS